VTQADPAALATAIGLGPTVIVFRTAFVAGSTTETVPESMFGTHNVQSINALASGFAPTATLARIVIVAGSIR